MSVSPRIDPRIINEHSTVLPQPAQRYMRGEQGSKCVFSGCLFFDRRGRWCEGRNSEGRRHGIGICPWFWSTGQYCYSICLRVQTLQIVQSNLSRIDVSRQRPGFEQSPVATSASATSFSRRSVVLTRRRRPSVNAFE